MIINTPTEKHRSCAIANIAVKDMSPVDLAKYFYDKHRIFHRRDQSEVSEGGEGYPAFVHDDAGFGYVCGCGGSGWTVNRGEFPDFPFTFWCHPGIFFLDQRSAGVKKNSGMTRLMLYEIFINFSSKSA